MRKLTDLRPQSKNANRHTQRGMGVLERSIEQDGWIGAITVAADGETFDGSARVEVGVTKGFEDAIVVESDGRKPVVLRRTDIPTADDPRAVRLGIAANRVAQLNLDWDTDILSDLQTEGVLDGLFSDTELDTLLASVTDDPQDDTEQEAVPAALFPTDNEWDIPLLDIRKQATSVDAPVVKWGVQARTNRMSGTYHFYTDDYKFSALWDDPRPIIQSGCQNVVEPNFSTFDTLPRIAALYRVYQKRWMARYWQEHGVRVFVDLNVSLPFADFNLWGVPKGWRSYATRGMESTLDLVENDYRIAVEHAETDDILFLVVGGTSKTKKMCGEHGWVYIPEGHSIKKEQDNG